MNEQSTKELKLRLGQLLKESLRINNPLTQLEIIREKLERRNYQSFDKEDIIMELGSLQGIVGEIHREMLRVHDHLKQQG
jgi:hypothetical protein